MSVIGINLGEKDIEGTIRFGKGVKIDVKEGDKVILYTDTETTMMRVSAAQLWATVHGVALAVRIEDCGTQLVMTDIK
jgi:hypothetical protein